MLGHRNLIAVPVLLGFTACAAFSNTKNDTLSQVDDLLGRIETVQVEAVVSKEKAHAAFDALHGLVAPDFHGDPVVEYAALREKVAESRTQALKLANAITPMKNSAETVFQEWTTNLESFGNTRLRQQSQNRLAETRARYESILTAARSAQVSYDAFNADLNDNALFLQHDFNSSAVATIAAEVEVLVTQAQELDSRLDATASAAKSYVESNALRGQISVAATDARPTTGGPAASDTTTTPPRKTRTTTLPPPQPGSTTPEGTTPVPGKPAPPTSNDPQSSSPTKPPRGGSAS